MQVLGFFLLPTSRTHGFTLIELLVCLALLSVLAAFAAPSWQRLSESSRVQATRDQLLNDLHAARVRAIQQGAPLQVVRLRDCSWGSNAENDWSCGWQVVVKANQNALHTTQLQTPLHVSFAKSTPLEINPRGDLGSVGDRWLIKSRQNTLNLANVVCLSSASRLRWQSGESCSN